MLVCARSVMVGPSMGKLEPNNERRTGPILSQLEFIVRTSILVVVARTVGCMLCQATGYTGRDLFEVKVATSTIAAPTRPALDESVAQSYAVPRRGQAHRCASRGTIPIEAALAERPRDRG